LELSIVIARNASHALSAGSATKQSDTKCHSEYFVLAQYRLREESQTDCFTSFAMTNVKSIASWSLN